MLETICVQIELSMLVILETTFNCVQTNEISFKNKVIYKLIHLQIIYIYI